MTLRLLAKTTVLYIIHIHLYSKYTTPQFLYIEYKCIYKGIYQNLKQMSGQHKPEQRTCGNSNLSNQTIEIRRKQNVCTKQSLHEHFSFLS